MFLQPSTPHNTEYNILLSLNSRILFLRGGYQPAKPVTWSDQAYDFFFSAKPVKFISSSFSVCYWYIIHLCIKSMELIRFTAISGVLLSALISFILRLYLSARISSEIFWFGHLQTAHEKVCIMKKMCVVLKKIAPE